MTPTLEDPFEYLKGRGDLPDDVRMEPDTTALRGCDPFGNEDMTRERRETVLDDVLRDIPTAVAEAVRYIYYTGASRRRNVRINSNNVSAEYWDGRRWWAKGLHDIVKDMTEFALGELEHCLDWSERLSDGTKQDFEDYLVAYSVDKDLRDSVRAQVIEVMIRPYPDDKD